MMPKNFAKLYETERGQVLVMRENGDDGPAVRVYFDPHVDGLGVSSIAVSGFGDNDSGHDKADQAFNAITEESAKGAAFRAMDEIAEMFGE